MSPRKIWGLREPEPLIGLATNALLPESEGLVFYKMADHCLVLLTITLT